MKKRISILAMIMAAAMSFTACSTGTPGGSTAAPAGSNEQPGKTTPQVTETARMPTEAATPPVSTERQISIDYADEVAFERALNAGENVIGKTAVFIAAELHPDSVYGYNIWSGEHLNFISAKDPGIKAGQQVTARITKAEKSMLGSWLLAYDVLDKKDADPSMTKAAKQDVVLKDSGYTAVEHFDYSLVYYAVTLENPNSNYAIEFPEINIVCRNKDGVILDTGDQTLSYIAAGDTITYASSFICHNGIPDKVEITASNAERNFELQSDKYVLSSAFECVNVAELESGITGEVKNTTAAKKSICVIAVCCKDGKMLGGAATYVDDVPAGGTKAFKIDRYQNIGDCDEIKTFAIEW